MRFSVFKNSFSKEAFSDLQLSDYASIVVNPETGGGTFIKGADLVKRIRATNDIERQRRLKQQLPAISPGALFGLNRQHVSCFTGLMQIDIDEGIQDPEELRNALGDISWVTFSSLSVRCGVWFLVKTPEPRRQPAYWKAINDWLQTSYQLSADPARKNPKDLRFFAPDKEAIFNPNAIAFKALPPEPILISKAVPYQKNNVASTNGCISPFKDFNQNADVISMLLNDGWTVAHRKGDKIRLTRPGKDHGISADWDENLRRLYVFTSNSNLAMEGNGHALSPVDIFMKLNEIHSVKYVRRQLTDLGYGKIRV